MKDEIKSKLSQLAKAIATLKSDHIERQKNNNNKLNRDDVIWLLLLQSFATWGGSYGLKGMIDNKENFNELTFDKIKSIPENERYNHIEKICKRAKIRMPPKKAKCILECFYQIENMGGLLEVKNKLLSQIGKKAKVNFLKQFTGIGEKHARNMMMDIYHEEFRDSIAIDARIRGISNSWNLKFKNYEEHENFYLEVAKDSNLSGWELDRLMYRYSEIFKNE